MPFIARCPVGPSGYRTADGLELIVHRADTSHGPTTCGDTPAWREPADPGQAMRRVTCHNCIDLWTQRTGLGPREQTADRMRYPVYGTHPGWVTQWERTIGHRVWRFYHSTTTERVYITAHPLDSRDESKRWTFPPDPRQPTLT
ncbi:hypothetical protein [Streptomyces sp. NBC_00470]|uniref:hypothetical protein n=1 Tax=Streptomyces sp. NBC_00470 TaxID=2975753 RepID=UPI002F918966